jgi:hypothetical protein
MIRNHSYYRRSGTSYANASASRAVIFFVFASGIVVACLRHALAPEGLAAAEIVLTEAFTFPKVRVHTRAKCLWRDPIPVQSKTPLSPTTHDGFSCSRDDKRHEPATIPSYSISIGDRFSVARRRRAVVALATKHAALLAVVVVSTPALAVAEAAAMTPGHHQRTTGNAAVVSSSFRDSPLVVAVAQSSSPYTGQLVDTANARLVKLDSGVTYRDLLEGTSGEGVAEEGNRVNIQWSLKRSNGYSIDSSALNDGVPFIFVVGDVGVVDADGKQPHTVIAIPGLDEGIRGMKVGGIRRIVVPPSLAYVGGLDTNSPGPVPPGFGPKQRIKRVMENRLDVPDESFLLDVKLTRVQ